MLREAPTVVEGTPEPPRTEPRLLIPARDDALPVYVQAQGAYVSRSGDVLVVKQKQEKVRLENHLRGHQTTAPLKISCLTPCRARAGARIETRPERSQAESQLSRPARARGLKRRPRR